MPFLHKPEEENMAASTLLAAIDAQLRAYMQGGEYAVGLLLNFSRENAQTRRLDEPQFAPKK